MKIVIAIDSFKGCASSSELSDAIKEGILNVYPNPEIIICPIADGGEGTVEALSSLDNSKTILVSCSNALGEPISAKYLILKNKTAVIEMSSASGLELIPKEDRDPNIASSYGTGELIKDAISKGSKEFIIGLGGSATNDAGLGMLRALGFRFFDHLDQEIFLTRDMNRISRIDQTNKMEELHYCEFLVACDVNNPLFGLNGASYIYGAQKGASPVDIIQLDTKLEHFAKISKENGFKESANKLGAGAAGGMGFAFMSFLNSTLQPGIQLILEQVQLKEKIKDANFLITGEGKIDKQSCMGKVIDGIGTLCKAHNIPCIALTGNSKESSTEVHQKGVSCVFSILNSPMTLEKAMDKQTALDSMKQKSEQVFRLISSLNQTNQSNQKVRINE